MSAKVYYQSERVTLWHGDCLEVLPTLSGVDAVVTDPPYGIAHKCNFAERGRSAEFRGKHGNVKWIGGNDYPDVAGDDQPFDPAPFLAMNVPTILWGGNHFAKALPPSGGWLVWDKERPDTLDQATCELAWTNCVKGVRRFRHLWNGMMRASERGENFHPTQKPAALFDWVFSLPWVPAGTVFDPFMGSGPCGVAALRSGRNYIGVELSEDYCAIAKRRIQEAEQAFALFEPATPEVQSQMFGAKP